MPGGRVRRRRAAPADLPHPHLRVPDERARLGAAGRARWWPTGWWRPTTWSRPTSWCSTPAASGRTPTTSSTATSGNLKTLRERRPDMQIAVGGCLAQMDKEKVRERAGHVDVVFGTHNLTSAPELLRRASVEGPIVEILDEPVPVGEPTAADQQTAALAAVRDLPVRGLGDHPDGVRQQLRVLHRPGGAGARGVPDRRRPGRRGGGAGPPGRDRGDPARPERELLRPRPDQAQPALRRPPAGHRCGRGHPTGPVHQSPPEGPPARGDRGDGRDPGGLQPPPPAAPVRQRPRPGGHAPGLHRRARTWTAWPRPEPASPTWPSPPTSSSASRARPRTTSSARSRWRPRPRSTAPTPSCSPPDPGPGPRT